MKQKTEYYLCHFSDGSGCWVWAWRGPDKPYTCYNDNGTIQHEPGREILPPDPGKREMRITRLLARALIRSWRKPRQNHGYR